MANIFYEVFSEKFTNTSGNDRILALVEFNGELFLGAGRAGGTVMSANLYRLTGDCCPEWKEVTPPWKSNTAGGSMAMQVFQGRLYVGTDQGQIFRTADGQNWTDVTNNLKPSGQIDDMAEFKGHLYVTGDIGIWRTANGSLWAPLVGPPPAAHPYGFGEPKNHDQRSLEVFKDYLYVGVGRDNNNGIQLWRTANGTNWIKFQEVLPQPGPISGVLNPGHVHALKTFKGYLYLGEYHGKGLYRTDGTAGSWEYIQDVIKEGDLFRFAVHNDKLYLGVSLHFNTAANQPLLYLSSDGKNWLPVPDSPVSDANHSRVPALTSFAGRLYAGFVNPGSSGTVEALEWGTEIGKDKYESNDVAANATPVKLPVTSTETMVELSDLTLHENDIDYYKIEYDSGLAQECFGQSPTVFPIGGPFYAESYPGYLSICACESYGRSLVVELYNSMGQKFKQYTTAGKIRINCPSQLFLDKKLYVSVSGPDSQPPVRYKLKIKYSNAYGRIFAHLDYKFWELLPPPYPPPPFFDFIDPAQKYFDISEMIALSAQYLTELIDYRGQIERGDLYHGLGRMAQQMGKSDEAERFLQDSLAGFQELGVPSREADLFCGLGNLYSSKGEAGEAVYHLQSALEIHESLEDLPGSALDRMALGRHYLISREPAEAIANLLQAQRIQSELEDHPGMVHSLANQAEAFLALEMPEAAVACFILAEALWLLTEDRGLRELLERWESAAASQIGEEAFKEIHQSLAGRAEEVWQEAIEEVTGI